MGCSPFGVARDGSGRFVRGSAKKTLALLLTAVILAATFLTLSITLARAAGVNSPEILPSSTPSSIDVNVNYSINVRVRDNDNLLDVNEVWLSLYENSLSQGAPDNVQNHYTFKWVRGVGFTEVGPSASNQHLGMEGSSPGSDSATTDNWIFRIKLDVVADSGSWNVWAKVLDNEGRQDNQEFANELTVNPHGQIPSLIVDSGLPFFVNELVKDNVPVAQPDGVGFDSASVYNPAVVYRDNKFYMFYRAQASWGDPASKIGEATSDTGENFQNNPNPAISNTEWYESVGVEDPRIVKIDNTYWMTYTGYDGSTARLALAKSDNLENWQKVGVAFPGGGWTKSGVIIPEKINGKYYMYYEGAKGGGDLYYATSDNLITWISGGIAMSTRTGYFDARTIEPGPQPILLDNGILVIYNSLDKGLGDGGTLATGWVIFARDDPTTIIARCEAPFLVPELSWEKSGQTQNCVFSEGLVQVNNTWYLYYGAADTVVGLARAPVRSGLWSVETPEEWGVAMSESGITTHKFEDGITIDTNTLARGWWRFNESTGTVASDLSGFGSTGTISGAAWTTGKSGSGLEFFRSDNNDRVDVGDPSNLEGFVGGLTISAWIKPYSKSHNGEIVKKNGVYLLRVNESLDNNVAFMVWSSDGTKYVLQVPDNLFPDNQWTMITATWDGSKMHIYKDNGNLVGQENASFERLNKNNETFCIGNQPGGGEGFDGLIDEVTVFDKALMGDDIINLYNSIGPTGLVQLGYWTSSFHKLGVPVYFKSIGMTASLVSGENAWVAVEVSRDGSSVEENLGWLTIQNGTNFIDLSSLPEDQYVRVKFKLETDDARHSPRLDRFTLDGRALGIMVSTDSASFAGGTSVTLKGTLLNLENEETQVWFAWKENKSSSWNETQKQTVSIRTPFFDNISGLTDDNIYEFRAFVRDLNSGETTSGAILTFKMDRTPPSLFTLLSPTNNSFTPENKRTTLKWKPSSDAGSGISYYEVWLNGIHVGDNVQTQFTTAPLPEGDYQWYVVAVDRLGNKRVSANTFNFTTGIPPRSFALISPQGAYTLENRVVLSWENSSSPVPSIPLAKYEIWINGEKVDEVPASLTYYVTPELPQGSYQWYVMAVNQVGNYCQSDNVFTFNIGPAPPYPMRYYFDGFEDNNLNGYVSYGMDTTSTSLYDAYSLEWTGPGKGYAYVSNVRLLNFEGATSVIFRLDDLNSKPGVGFASDDGTMVFALVDVRKGWLRIERKGPESAYGTVPIDYRLTKSPFISLNWDTETQDDDLYTLDVERFGISGLNVNTSYRLTLYFSTRSMAAMAFLEDLNGSVLSQVRATVDVAPDHPLLLSDGPVRFDNLSFNVVDNWVYNWEPILQPVLSPTPDNWDAKGAFNPTVGIWDNEFRMFYRGNKDPQPPAGPASSSIGYATSTDGINWTKSPTPVLQRLENGAGISLEDPFLMINPFGDNIQYLAYTDYNGGNPTPSKMRSFKFNPDNDNSILWENGPWTINWENKITAIVDTSASSWGHPVLYNGENYRFFSVMEPSNSMGFSNDLYTWVWRYGTTIDRSDLTWSNNQNGTVAEVPSGAMIMPDGNILEATCMTTNYGYVGGTQATVGTAVFRGSQPWVLLARATLPWAPDYYGDVDTAAADLTKDNRSWYDGPNFPGKSFVLTPDNWLYFYYGGNDQYTGAARTYFGPEFDYRGLMLSKGIVNPKETFVASVVVRNVGNLAGQENVKLFLNGALENSQIISLERNNETTVQFAVTINQGGIYVVQAGDMSSTVWVIAPGVAATTPENNSRALVNDNVVVVFNKSLDSSINPTLTQTTGTQVTYAAPRWSANNTTVTWTHNDWENGENVTLTVSGYKDLGGNVGDNYTWSFKTFTGAVATGPVGYSNTRNVTITYKFSGSPVNVKIYYSTDDGTTWNLAGTDNTIDSNFGWTAPKDNLYWWNAVVPGSENDPPTEAGPLVIDIAAPLQPENLFAYPGIWSSTNSFDLYWNNPADLSGIDGVYYKLNAAPTSGSDGTFVPGNNITSISDVKATMQGSNTIYVWLRDKAGNADKANSSSTVLLLDNVAPSAFNLISPENKARIQDNTPTLVWENSSDNVSGLAHYEVWLDGSNVDNVIENEDTSSVLIPQTSHTWRVVAVDNAGNRRTSDDFNFILTVPDNTPPSTFDLLSPENNATIDTATPTLTWQASSDNESGLWQYEIWLDGSNVDNVSLDRTSYLTQLLSEGSHQWYIVAVDNAVNKTQSNTFTFTIRTIALINYVDPFIGTLYGRLSPGPTVPFAMTSWDPVRKEEASALDYPYSYDMTEIAGFRGSHYPSGSSASDYGPITIMPESGKLVLGPDRASSFSHASEEASPGYYAVTLDNYGIRAELTSTIRAGIFKFTYSQAGVANILVDTQLGTGYEKVVPENNEIIGYSSAANYKGPTGIFNGYFVIKFYNKSFSSYGTWTQAINGHLWKAEENAYNSGAWVTFSVSEGETVMVKAAMSFISIDQARANLNSEISDWDFGRVRSASENTWESALSVIDVIGGSQDQKKIFYTALYHTMLSPRVSSEGGRYYSVFDANVHSGNFYDGYSMWDTFRAEQALLILTQPTGVIADMAQSIVDMYEQGGWMPKWPDPGYSSLMIGTHGDSILTETYLKGITGFDINAAYAGMVKNATQTPPAFYEARTGINDYMALHYAPADKTYTESTSLTLEYAYDDWSIAQLAKELGKDSDYNYYMNRATYYRNVFDSSVGFIRGRNSDGSWAETTYDPTGFYSWMTQPNEGDPWQYTWFVPQDVWGLKQLIDGSKNNSSNPGDFITKLETVLQQSEEPGLIADNEYAEHGRVRYYWHGNEPGEQIPYMFDYAGEPWRTQYWVDSVMKTRYRTYPYGLPGNDDCGQISAWYVLSAMGFYTVEPPSLTYEIGRPIFDKVTIHLPNGKEFVIEAQNVSDSNMYIQSATLNGRPLNKPWFDHSQLESGGKLTFVMGSSPNESWGSHPSDAPPSMSGPKFAVDNLRINPPSVTQDENENMVVSVRVTNIGTAEGPKLVRLEIDGSVVDDNEVTLSPGDSQIVSFNISENELGVHIVYIDDLQGTFIVEGGKFLVENLKIYPQRVFLGENVTISADVANIGDKTATKFLVLKIDNLVESIENVTLDSGENSTLSFVVSRDVAGVYEVEIENLVGSFVVENQSGSANFVLSNLRISPRRVDIGENVTVSVDVVNRGDASGSYIITLKVDGLVKNSDNVNVDPASSERVSFVVTMDNSGPHNVAVNQLMDYVWAINSSGAEITKLVEVGALNPGENKEIDIDGISITKLVITTVNSIDNEQIEILQFAGKPNGVPLAPGIVYKYLIITPRASREEDIENIVIGFKVELSWMSKKGVSSGDMVLRRYNPENQGWQELPTTFVEQDGTYAYFEAISTKFSVYSISTRSGINPGGFPLPAAITGVVVLAAAIAGGYFLWMRKNVLASSEK